MVLLLIISVLVGTFSAEVVLRTFGGVWFSGQLGDLRVSLHALRQADGDEAKQALMLSTGRLAIRFSMTASGVLAGLFAIASLAPWVLHWSESQQMTYIVASSLAATVWWPLRNLGRGNTAAAPTVRHAYGALERWLHWIALKPAVVRQLTFALERQFALPKRSNSITSAPPPSQAEDPADGAVYVCGLARSGTTMLLQILDQIDEFRSLHYTDMPFVLAPNLWKQITRRFPRQSVAAERAHGDGIHVSVDSPEGFEEVFWRTFGTSTSEPGWLGADEPSPQTLATFADYRALVANPRTERGPATGILRRYLSKNNNNLLRLHSLCADPTATVLLVYRNPLATARSLHRQHQRFCAIQTEDRFTRTYMGWLSHHEFGLDHLPFGFAVSETDNARTPEDPNYWLDYWNAVYRHVLSNKDLRLHLVNHDALRADPTRMLGAIFTVLGVHADAETLAKQIAPPVSDAESTDGLCPELVRKAQATHCTLLSSPMNIQKSNLSRSHESS